MPDIIGNSVGLVAAGYEGDACGQSVVYPDIAGVGMTGVVVIYRIVQVISRIGRANVHHLFNRNHGAVDKGRGSLGGPLPFKPRIYKIFQRDLINKGGIIRHR